MSAFEFAPTLAGPAPARRRKVSREAAVAIGVSVLFHVGVVGYIATQTFSEIRFIHPDDPPSILIESFKLPKLEPQKPLERVKPMNPIQIHNTTPYVDPRVEPIAAVVQPDAPASTGTTVIPQEIIPPQPPIVVADARPDPKPRVIRNPTWLKRPTAAEMGRLYPQRAIDLNLSGAATLMCEVVASGSVRNCAVVDESPKGRGFGEAALASARLFKLNPRTEDGETVEGAKVRIPLVFNLAG